MQKKFSIVLIISLIVSLGIAPYSSISAQATPVVLGDSGRASSDKPPAGYTPKIGLGQAGAANIGNADILLVQTALPWNSEANTQVLNTLGYTYDIVDMSNIAQVDLFSYPVVLIVNDQVQAFYDQYASQASAFEDYVTNGGTLVFFAASDGWAGGTLKADLPGGVKVTTPWYEYYNYIADPYHPIITGQLSDGNSLTNNDLYSNYCSHGYFSALPANTNVILQESHGHPTIVEYKLGQGTVIASTLTWEHDWFYHTGNDQYGTFASKALDDVFLYAFSTGKVVDGIIHVFPSSVPADDATTANVTLTGATPGHRVRLISSRGSVDTFGSATGIANNQGRFVTTIHSATVGTVVLTAQDLNTGQTFPATTSINFAPVGGTPEPPTKDPIAITSVNAEHPLDARYLEGIPVSNRIDVTVDWHGSTPGHVDFILNDATFSEPASGATVSHPFDMGNGLRHGQNTLRIVAYNASGQASKEKTFGPYLTAMPIWLGGLMTVGAIAPMSLGGSWTPSSEYESKIKIPAGLFNLGIPNFGPEGTKSEINFVASGDLVLPIHCSDSLKMSITRGAEAKVTFSSIELGGEFNGMGSIEAKSIDCEIPTAQGTLKIDVKVYGQKNWPVIVFVANFVSPAIGAGLEEILSDLGVNPKNIGEIYLQGSLHGSWESGVSTFLTSPYLKWDGVRVGFGPGIEGGYNWDLKVAELKVSIGADGTIELYNPNSLIDLSGLRPDRVTVGGEAAYEVRALFFVSEHKYRIEWTYPPQARSMVARILSESASSWHLMDHNSRNDYASFHAVQSAGLRSATSTSILVSNVYTYAEPSLAVNLANNNALLLWTHDDINKPVGQAHEIEFSSWNGTKWSAPVGVTNDNLLDSAPEVAWTSEGKGIAVWQRLNSVLPPNATLDANTTKQIEIATATYDPSANAWSPVALLTTNNALDMTPYLARNSNGNLVAVWRQNSAGLLGGDATNPDRIMTAFYTNGWSTPQIAVDNIPGLVDLAVGYGSNTATLAFTRYLAPTGSITPTLQLFTSTWNGANWSAPMQLTNDAAGHTNPQIIYNTANQPLLVWSAGYELRLRNLTTNNTVVLTLPPSIGNIDEFRTVQDASGNVAAIFTAQGSQRDLFVSFYDQPHNLWGKPTPLTDDRASESYPAPAIDTNGRLLLAYTGTAITSVVKTATDSTTGQTITFTVPTEGQTDLLTLSHEFGRNLTLNNGGFQVSNTYPQPGNNVTLMATLTNTGDLVLDNVAGAFYDGNPSAGGALIGISSLATPLAAGFTTTLTTTYTIPATGGIHQFYAVADPNNAFQETDETDNQASFEAFGPDLTLDSFAINYWGSNNIDLVSRISNLGTTTSPTTTLAFYQDALTGAVLLTDNVPPIAAGDQFTLTTPWNYGNLAAGSYALFALVNPSTTFAEANLANNSATTTLNVGPDLMVSPYYFQTSSLTATTAIFTATLYNIGATSVNNAKVDFYRRGDLATRSRVFSASVPTLDPGKATILNGQVAGPLGCGLYIQADPDHIVNEVSKANNLAYVPASGGRCASFYNTPLTAIAPAAVVFADTSTGNNTAWLWDFGDGTTSTQQNPVHQYSGRGAYTVTLTVSGADGGDTYALPNAVRIYQQVQANFDAAPLNGMAPLQVLFNDHSTGDINSWSWDFGDGSSSFTQNPVHTYTTVGTYPVTLTVSGLGGQNTQVRSAYITVSEPPTPTPTNTPTPTSTATPVSTATVTPTATPTRMPNTDNNVHSYLPLIQR